MRVLSVCSAGCGVQIRGARRKDIFLLQNLKTDSVFFFYVLLTVHPNVMIVFFTNLTHKFFTILCTEPSHKESDVTR